MREILHVQVGQCGNQMGTKFWEGISKEHDVAPDGQVTATEIISNLDVYYAEASSGTWRLCLRRMGLDWTGRGPNEVG